MPGKLFFGGVPTDPEVNMLRERYPVADMSPGRVIPYNEVADLIGCPRDDRRFTTITNRWRRLVENETQTVVIGTLRGVGFKVLDNTGKIDLGQTKLVTAVRSARRSYKLTATVRGQLSEEDKERLIQLQRRSGALLATAQIKSNVELPKLEGVES